MKIFKRFLIICGIVALLALGAGVATFWYLGGFTKLTPVEQQFGPVTMVYVEHTGDYKLVGPAMQTLYDDLTGAGITQIQGIGIYYSDPASTPVDQLYAEVGSIVSGNVQGLRTGYKIETLTGCQAVVVSFPYKHPFSYMLGPIVVYPYVGGYMANKGYKVEVPRIEVYDEGAKKIDFIACVEKIK